jgi:hypothetical protein
MQLVDAHQEGMRPWRPSAQLVCRPLRQVFDPGPTPDRLLQLAAALEAAVQRGELGAPSPDTV